jgi:hypothetical protein
METPEILGPSLLKMIGNRTFDLLHQSSPGYTYRAAWLHKLSEVIQVKVVRPVVRKGINAQDGVEELRGEGQRTGVGMDWKYALLETRIPDSLHVL